MTWDDALELVADRFRRAKAEAGGASILPFSYGGSNGLLTQDNLDAQLWRRFGTSRLARTVCAAPTGAANQALYGKMPSVTYQDYPEAALIVLWGVNPSASGIHLVPYVREAQKRGATLVVVDPRTTALARAADVHLPVKPGTDVAVALAIHRYLFANGHADEAFLREHTTGADRLRERAAPWTIERAADVAGVDRRRARAVGRAVCDELAGAHPLRLGPRAESQRRQRGDGGAGAAGGRRQVRRPGRRLFDEQLGIVGHRAHLDSTTTSRRRGWST